VIILLVLNSEQYYHFFRMRRPQAAIIHFGDMTKGADDLTAHRSKGKSIKLPK
jgi:hypothetical protein